MAMKVKTLTEKNHVDSLRTRLTEAQEKAAALELHLCKALDENSNLTTDLRAARGRINEVEGKLENSLRANAELQRQVGRLEGYKQRVERTDDLARNVPPMDHVDGRSGMAVDFTSYPRGNRPDGGWSGRQR